MNFITYLKVGFLLIGQSFGRAKYCGICRLMMIFYFESTQVGCRICGLLRESILSACKKTSNMLGKSSVKRK